MRQLHGFQLSTLLAVISLGILQTGCLPDHNPSPLSCRLTSATQPANLVNSFFRSEEWVYNVGGRLDIYKNQVGRTLITNQYTYDNNGYMISNESRPLSNEVYGYVNGRLTTATRTGSISQQIDQTTTYEYDGSGKLTRIVISRTDPFEIETYFFNNGLQTGYKISTVARLDFQPYTFENGLVKESTLQTPTTYTYDSQGRRTRVDFSGSAQYDYMLYEYATGRLTSEAAPSLFKGWPDELRTPLNSTGEGQGLLSKVHYFVKGTAGTFVKSREILFSSTQNRNGFPLTVQAVDRSYTSAGEQTSERTYEVASYSYDNCQ
ncbi:hypothetical protein FAES_1161 [Fibrella aestuarina BUZ 2]|uniref:YD repeat-containing protein n=1 Tax=Fibrella aestuarina BUZ 2 TaxID=1166018 RepID=I0K4W8_9BACT|nr:hypothetical protein [Fibrella aestuarina]CCG99171.1 hypothetical protein FAES_1161 [Fibrella aestuarina BUZ 2]